MVSKGLLAETPARAGDPVWDQTDDGGALTLVATVNGLAAIGIEPEGTDAPDTETAPEPASGAGTGARKGKGTRKPRASQKAAQRAPRAKDRAQRPGTKQAALIAMLREPAGASIDEIAQRMGAEAHGPRRHRPSRRSSA